MRYWSWELTTDVFNTVKTGAWHKCHKHDGKS